MAGVKAYTAKHLAGAAGAAGVGSYLLRGRDNKTVTEDTVQKAYDKQKEEEQVVQKKKKTTMGVIFSVIMLCCCVMIAMGVIASTKSSGEGSDGSSNTSGGQ